jgi:hypothetical protein
VLKDPARPAEQCDCKAKLLVPCLAFDIGDATLAFVFAQGYDIQSCEVRKRKGVSEESKYELRREGR